MGQKFRPGSVPDAQCELVNKHRQQAEDGRGLLSKVFAALILHNTSVKHEVKI